MTKRTKKTRAPKKVKTNSGHGRLIVQMHAEGKSLHEIKAEIGTSHYYHIYRTLRNKKALNNITSPVNCFCANKLVYREMRQEYITIGQWSVFYGLNGNEVVETLNKLHYLPNHLTQEEESLVSKLVKDFPALSSSYKGE